MEPRNPLPGLLAPAQPSIWAGCQLTTPRLDSPVSDRNAQGLAHERVGLDGLTEERPVVPHTAQVVHTAVHKGRGVHDSAALPQGAVCPVEEATVVGAKEERFGGRVTHGAVVHTARITLPVGVVDPPALSEVQDGHGRPAVRAEEVVQGVFIVVPTEATRGVYIGAWDGNGGVVLAVKRH